MCRRHATLLAAVSLIGLGCGPKAGTGTMVVMYDNQYNAPVTKIPTGTRITFMNEGGNLHNATAVDGAWKSGDVPARTGGTGQGGDVVFDKPGIYHYYCTYHGTKDGNGMAGVIVVGDTTYVASPKGVLAPASAPTGTTRKVPADYPTIQAAVDAAAPGDMVLVGRGVYKEEVTVTTPSLVIRGEDRNATVIDGEFVRGNGISVLADNVAVENMTARNALLNGFFWSGVTGFRGTYLTAYNNGTYGIYAFNASDGLFEESYASGNPDSGFYIGACFPCNAVVRRVVSERNGLGFSGTNAGGRLYVVSSVWRYNRSGIVPTSLDVELQAPQRSAVFAANLVYSNNNRNAPAITLNTITLGSGMLMAGAVDDTVERNVVVDHESNGIVLTPMQDRNYYPAHGNVIRNNIVLGSGRADLVNAGPGASGNCFAGNTSESSIPFALEALQGCGGFRLPWWSDLVTFGTIIRRLGLAGDVVIPDWKTQPEPPPQPTMPDASTRPPVLAREVFASIGFDLAKAELPAGADSIAAAARAGRAPPGTPNDGVRFIRAGLGGAVAANLGFLAAPLVVLWWLRRALRRGPAVPGRRWVRRLAVAGSGLAVWAVVYLVSVFYYARL
jgi:plastocyanin